MLEQNIPKLFGKRWNVGRQRNVAAASAVSIRNCTTILDDWTILPNGKSIYYRHSLHTKEGCQRDCTTRCVEEEEEEEEGDKEKT